MPVIALSSFNNNSNLQDSPYSCPHGRSVGGGKGGEGLPGEGEGRVGGIREEREAKDHVAAVASALMGKRSKGEVMGQI